jgi:predicted metallo-beta-lactamase superfamily hydrolase
MENRMLTKIRVLPLAAESLGVRSLCTYVETETLRVLLDAGVSIAPYRFRLPPHPQEFQAIIEARRRIAEYAEKADVVTISHYHFDHHTPSYEDWVCNWTDSATAQQIYEDKLVLMKSYREHVNTSQRRRGWLFTKTGGKHAKKLKFADGQEFHFNGSILRFSPPVFHGSPNSPLGWVIMTTIENEDEKFLFASDVQGPMNTTATKMILNEKPHLLIVGGPPIYLTGSNVSEIQIQHAMRNLKKLGRKIPTIIADHHLLRSQTWQQDMQQVRKATEKVGNRIVSAAEYLKKTPRLLESRRKELFEADPPTSEFTKWANQQELKRKRIKPPL